MLEIVKETLLFLMIAQAILFFVPGEHYGKYVKVIIGILLIARLAAPLLMLFEREDFEERLALHLTGDVWQQAGESELANREGSTPAAADSMEEQFLARMEEEVKRQLNAGADNGYTVKELSLSLARDEAGQLIVSQARLQVEAPLGQEERMTKEQATAWYGEQLALAADQVTVRYR